MPQGDTDEGSCEGTAEYEAFVDWTAGIMLLCEEHALLARADKSVTSIQRIAQRRPTVGGEPQ
jgi:hypothetical protein